MAKTYIEVQKIATAGTYKAILSHDYSDKEYAEMLRKTGYVEIETGGTFTQVVPVYGSVTMTIPSNIVKFPDSFPLVFLSTVDGAGGDYELAAARCDAWVLNAIAVLTAALQARWTDTSGLAFEDTYTVEVIGT